MVTKKTQTKIVKKVPLKVAKTTSIKTVKKSISIQTAKLSHDAPAKNEMKPKSPSQGIRLLKKLQTAEGWKREAEKQHLGKKK